MSDENPETLDDILAEMELGDTCDFPFAYRVGMPDEPEVIDVTGAIIKPRTIRIKKVTVEELVNRIKAAREREPGIAAAMREALVHAHQFLHQGRGATGEKWLALVEEINAALALPRRQCDVGTAEEQYGRYEKFCCSHYREYSVGHCSQCPFSEPTCKLEWAQMPYEEGGAK